MAVLAMSHGELSRFDTLMRIDRGVRALLAGLILVLAGIAHSPSCDHQVAHQTVALIRASAGFAIRHRRPRTTK